MSSSFQAVLEESLGVMTYLPETKRYMEWSMCSNPQRLEASSHKFKMAEAQLQKEAKRAQKLAQPNMRSFIAVIALAAFAAAATKGKAKAAPRLNFINALDSRSKWNSFKQRTGEHERKSEAKRGIRLQKVKEYFAAKERAARAAKNMRHAGIVLGQKTKIWNAARIKTAQYKATMQKKHKRFVQLTKYLAKAKRQFKGQKAKDAAAVAKAIAQQGASANHWRGVVSKAKAAAGVAKNDYNRARQTASKAKSVAGAAHRNWKIAMGVQRQATRSNTKAIRAKRASKAAAIAAHKTYVKFVKEGASRGMIH